MRRRTTRLDVGDHTLTALVPGAEPPEPAQLVDEMTHAVYRLLADTCRPMPVIEIAFRLRLPRVVAVTIVTVLATHHRVRISQPEPSTGFLRQACTATRQDIPAVLRMATPGLASAKVVVIGGAGAGCSTFVGAGSEHAPVRTLETTADHQGRLVALSLEMGAIEVSPTSRLHLLAAPSPDAFDALWPGVIRHAVGAIVLVHPQRPKEGLSAVLAVRDAGVPFQVVINHTEGSEPDPTEIGVVLDVPLDLITVADARSRPAARSALSDLLRRALEVSS